MEMSIRLLAIELYRAQQNVARIAAQIEAQSLSSSAETMAAVLEELRQAEAELKMLRKMLDDKKSSSSPPRPC
jgi:prefoldin subunit 5